MDNLERKVNLLIEFITAEDEATRKKVIESFRGLETAALESQPVDEKSMMRTVDSMLCSLGVPTSLLGYEYLKHAIVLAATTPAVSRSITKELYPAIAKKSNTTPSRAERAMRHAIEVAWSRGDIDVFDRYFGNTVDPNRGRPTNAEFVCQMAAELRRLFDI